MMLNFSASREESMKIGRIVSRYYAITNAIGDRLSVIMDIESCHCNGCPLDLEGLLRAEAIDLAHDVSGIRRNLNRDTGKLENCFLPRYAKSRQTV